MKKKVSKKRVGLIIANVLTIIICLFVLLVAIMAITNARQGYNNLFGSTFLAVQTNSMDGDKKDSFKEGDLVVAKILKSKDKDKLKEDDIITFWMFKDGEKKLNTHRIIGIEVNENGTFYTTKGDNNTAEDTKRVVKSDIVAKYQFKLSGMGKGILFLQSKTGFFVFIVIPSILAVGYCVFLFVINLKGYNKVKKEEDKEKMKKQLLEELAKEENKEKEKN